MIEKAYSYGKRQKWIARIYVIMVLAIVGIYAVLMNYTEALGTRLAMTIGYGLMIASFSCIYSFWLTFSYVFVEGKDGKTVQDILACVCYMPFSVGNWNGRVKEKVFGKIKLYSGCVFLILAAGMFVGPCDDEKLGISLYMPENWLISIIVCVEGTWLVFLFMYAGYKVMLNSVVDRELKKRIGGKGKRKNIDKGNGGNRGKRASKKNFGDGVSAEKKGADTEQNKWRKRVGNILPFAIYFLMVLVIIPMLSGGYYESLYGTKVPYLITESPFYYGIWFIAIGWITWLLKSDTLEALPELQDDNGRMIKPSIPTDWKIGFTVGAICITFILSALSTVWHECFTLEGVEVHHFNTKKKYTWEDVDYYTVEKEGALGELVCMKLYMTDGENYDITGSAWQILYYNNAFANQFKDDEWKYAIWIAKTLQEKEISLKLDSWGKLEEELSSDPQRIQVKQMKEALGVDE